MSQHAGTWIFVAAFCVAVFIVAVLVALAPVKERQIRLLVSIGVGTGLLLAGRVSIPDSHMRQAGRKDTYPDEVWPVELCVWAVDHDARWHLASLVAEEIEEPGERLDPASPLYRSLTAATRETPQETLWQSPLLLPQVCWWVGSYEGGKDKLYQERDKEGRRELLVPQADESGSRRLGAG